jgi:uncharacterized protein
MPGSLQPLAINQRDQSLDVLRGFALAGVLFVFCVSDVGAASSYNSSVADEIVNWFKYLLIEGRMYGMLIVIFGVGFYVQLEKAKRQEASLVPAFSRRLFGLLIIGFIHAILFSTRDILMFYAIAGILLLAVRNLNNRQLLLCMLFLFFIVQVVLIAFARIPFGEPWALVEPNELIAHLKYNWQFFKLYHQFYTIYIDMLLSFMIGFWIGRMGLLQKLKTDNKFRRRLVLITSIASPILIYMSYYGIDQVYNPAIVKSHPWLRWVVMIVVRTIWEGGQLACVFLYASLLISLYVTNKGKKWLNPLAAFGQIALSNYLIQSLILIPYLLFFNKFKNLPPFEGFILFLVVFALQLVFSTWWLSRFTLGPIEWLLRSFTYWKWQKIKRPAPVEKNFQPLFN